MTMIIKEDMMATPVRSALFLTFFLTLSAELANAKGTPLEGVYSFETDAIQGERDLRIVVIDVRGNGRVSATIGSADSGINYYYFTGLNVEDEGFRLSGVSSRFSPPSNLNLVKTSNGLIQGTFLYGDLLEKKSFIGQRLAKLTFPSPKKKCDFQDLEGTYRAKVAGLNGSVTIRPLDEDSIAAIFETYDDSLRIVFNDGRYKRETGVLTLSNTPSPIRIDPLVWRLIVTPNSSSQCEFNGVGVSLRSGQHYDVNFSYS